MSYAHLHVHSVYSLLDGAGKIETLINKAKSLGQNAIAITDHGVMYGVIDFYECALKNGIKPIIGSEIYVAPRSRFDKTYGLDRKSNHLVLLAKNKEGYDSLKKIVSIGFIEGFFYKPRVDLEILQKYSNGLIALSACIHGEISRKIMEDNFCGAKDAAKRFKEIFKKNFYLEIQDHGILVEKKINEKIIRIGDELDIDIVATNDVHYTNKEDAKIHDLLLCIQTNQVITEQNRMKFETDEFYVKSEAEMLENFSFIPESLDNSQKIANECNVVIKYDAEHPHMPKYKIPEEKDSFEFLEKLCEEGFSCKYKNIKKDNIAAVKATERLRHELNMIKKMKFVDYFLIVWDFVKYAKDMNIMVGPGRGSGAGSIVSYCLNITSVDPLQYGLVFERFLNLGRLTMPDIDIDFCYEGRQQVIDYVTKRYGEEHVCQIITFGTMGARQSIRDVGRVLNMPYSFVDSVAKLIPFAIDTTIEKAIVSNKTLQEKYENDSGVRELINLATEIEGFPRHTSTHAAGIVICKEKITNYVPIQKNKEVVTTQFPMHTIEKLGLLKIDFLGLRTLTIIRDAVLNIIFTKNIHVQIDLIDLNDKAVYAMIANGDVSGLFQLEGDQLKKQFLKELKPSNFEEIIAAISLYRPGPMDSISTYIKNKNKKNIIYKHPLLKNILDVTYGCIVYQEQVIKIVQTLGGFSLEHADLMRRSISKKDNSAMESERKNFIYGKKDENGRVLIKGAIKNGIREETAKEIFDEISHFAKYAFNKSHAAAYAKIAFTTAWLKCHYRIEYMAAVLTNALGKISQIIKYVYECRKNNIKILGPDINKSFKGFVVDSGNIRFGLAGIKHVGATFAQNIIEEREKGGVFLSFTNFCRRILDKDLNKRMIEWCIKSGCFDSFGKKRSQLLSSYEKIINEEIVRKKNMIDGQIDLFNFSLEEMQDEIFEEMDEFSSREISNMEKESVGIYITSHPLEKYNLVSKKYSNTSIIKIYEDAASIEIGNNTAAVANESITVFGIITKIKTKITKNKNVMATLSVEDLSGEIDVIVFPTQFLKFQEILNEDNIVILKGKLDSQENSEPKIILGSVRIFDENLEKTVKIYLQITSKQTEILKKIKSLAAMFPGNVLVCIYFKDTKNTQILKNIKTSVNDLIINEFTKLVGEGNIKIMENESVFE